jgi:gas vesicle protein
MSMGDQMVNKSTATALIAGALLGAGIALLFAPQSGRKTRRKIRQFAEKAGSKAQAARLELQHSLDNIIGDVEERLQSGLVSGTEWTETKLADLRGAMEATRKSIGEQLERIQSR